MICEIKAANTRSGNYESCDQVATRISRFGWCACEVHASMADTLLTEIEPQDLNERLALRPPKIPEFREEVFMDKELGVVTMGSST